uniref:Glucosylceramidase n=1 Tax=Pyrodinium bahamense TaxID=73915 RepID=A0A7S0ATM4_9DINO|mmetsp:Transcript_41651/g.116002  ORF Transcript_41651/g.116002 Transcript_41651/m.116002 type:complete len:723 (+) Transcript_41651:75-2243(+)
MASASPEEYAGFGRDPEAAALLQGSSGSGRLPAARSHRGRPAGSSTRCCWGRGQDWPSVRSWNAAFLALCGLGAAVVGISLLGATTSSRVSRGTSEGLAGVTRSWAAASSVKLVQTARDVGDRLAEMPDLDLVPDFNFDGPVIDIDSSTVDQELLGFGGAFTEASAVTFQQLSRTLQEQILEQYFGASGLRYTMGRVHINSCDFSVASYSFDEQYGDSNLVSFDDQLMHDKKALIPLLKRAKLKVEETAKAMGESGLSLLVRADSQAIGKAGALGVIDYGGGHISLQTASGGYITADDTGLLVIKQSELGDGSNRFQMTTNSDGTVSLRASSGKYVTALEDGTLRAQAQRIRDWEKFRRTDAGSALNKLALRSAHGGYVTERPQMQGLRLLATPWSPPAWMKTNGQMVGSGTPCLREEYRATWAQYVVRWISAYAAQGLRMWALSVQNEPTNNPGWEACTLSPAEEADFLAYHLGPAVKAKHPDIAIFVYDDSKHLLPQYVNIALQHPTAAQYVQGAAFHWYTGDLFDRVSNVHQAFPQVMLLASEATYERRMWLPDQSSAYSDWRFGEGYAHDIIGDLNAGAVGWLDWNLLLDKTGGPNHVGNVCDAAVVADCEAQKLDFHPQYYYIGHFSKYIPPGSKRVGTSAKLFSTEYPTSTRPGPYGTCTGRAGLETTAFRRPDGWIAAVVLNCANVHIAFKLRHSASAVNANIPAHAIQTYLLPP